VLSHFRIGWSLFSGIRCSLCPDFTAISHFTILITIPLQKGTGWEIASIVLIGISNAHPPSQTLSKPSTPFQPIKKRSQTTDCLTLYSSPPQILAPNWRQRKNHFQRRRVSLRARVKKKTEPCSSLSLFTLTLFFVGPAGLEPATP
jgi:hypothetical protein